MQNEREKKRKGSKIKGRIILILLITVVLGTSAGMLYIDSVYGEGKMKSWLQIFGKDNSTTAKNAPTPTTFAENTEVQEDAEEEEVETNINSNESISLETDGQTYFVTYGKRIFMCTKDGVQFLNSIGDQKWNDTFTMVSPYVIKEGNFTAVGDMSGRAVYVYNDIGKQYSVQAEGSLAWFALNQNGYLSVISNNDSHYEIIVYDQTGQKLTSRVEESQGIYPLSVDISDDNMIFAISYLDVSDVEPISKIVYFYVGNSGKEDEFTDSMFAAQEKPEQMVATISFMKGGILAAVSDKTIIGLSLAGEVEWEIPLTNRVERVDFSNKEYILVSLGDSLSGQEGVDAGSVYWINTAGKTMATFVAGGKVDYLKSSLELDIIGSQNHFYGVKSNGKVLWEYSSKAEVSDILMMDSNTKALYVSKQSAKIVDMLQKSSSEKPTAKSVDQKKIPTKEDGTKEDSTNEGTTEAPNESGSEPTEEAPNESGSEPTEEAPNESGSEPTEEAPNELGSEPAEEPAA